MRQHEDRKQRVYAVAAMTGIGITLVSWITGDPHDMTIGFGYPVLALGLAGFLVAVLRGWGPLQRLERAILALLSVMIMGRLAWHVLPAGDIDDRLLVLVGGSYWAVAVLVLAGFVLLERRHALQFGAAVLALSVVLVGMGVGPQLVGPDGSSEALLYLVRVHGFLLALLLLTLAVASLREQLHVALSRAETYEHLAITDPLTGIANRRAATETLRRELDAAERHGRTVSVVVLDLDNFKAVNDLHGHEVGDQVLADLGALLREAARKLDLVARWGGEEFLLVAPETTRTEAARLAERIRRAIIQQQPGGLEVTATLAVAQHRADEDLSSLLRRADQLLYAAKDAGRDRVLCDDDTSTPSRAGVTPDARRAESDDGPPPSRRVGSPAGG